MSTKTYPSVIMTEVEAQEIAKTFDFGIDEVFIKEKAVHPSWVYQVFTFRKKIPMEMRERIFHELYRSGKREWRNKPD